MILLMICRALGSNLVMPSLIRFINAACDAWTDASMQSLAIILLQANLIDFPVHYSFCRPPQ